MSNYYYLVQTGADYIRLVLETGHIECKIGANLYTTPIASRGGLASALFAQFGGGALTKIVEHDGTVRRLLSVGTPSHVSSATPDSAWRDDAPPPWVASPASGVDCTQSLDGWRASQATPSSNGGAHLETNMLAQLDLWTDATVLNVDVTLTDNAADLNSNQIAIYDSDTGTWTPFAIGVLGSSTKVCALPGTGTRHVQIVSSGTRSSLGVFIRGATGNGTTLRVMSPPPVHGVRVFTVGTGGGILPPTLADAQAAAKAIFYAVMASGLASGSAVVWLEVGTNDYNSTRYAQPPTVPPAVDPAYGTNWTQFITEVRALLPAATIFVTEIFPRNDTVNGSGQPVGNFNALAQAAVAAFADPKIIWLPTSTVITAPADISNNPHWNLVGHAKVATWAEGAFGISAGEEKVLVIYNDSLPFNCPVGSVIARDSCVGLLRTWGGS